MLIVDGKSDEEKTSGLTIYQLNDKFIGLLRARNCICKTTFGRYRKTEVFTEWLKERKARGDSAETSNILETSASKPPVEKHYIPADIMADIKSSKRKSAA